MPNQTMQGLAGILAEQGRYGDTMLMHVAPSEVKYLADLGGITENPMTGLPEAFKFKDLLPFVGSAFLGPAFKAVGFSPGVSSFLASTASTMIGGGSLEKGIMSGLVSSSLGRLGRNLAATSPDAAVNAATGQPIADTGYKFGIFKKPETGTFGSRYSEAFKSPEFNPIEMAKVATEGGLDNFMEQIQKPGVLLPLTTGLGELARINAEEDYIRQYQNFLTSQAQRRKQLQTKYPQIVPSSNPYYRPGMAEGGTVQRKYDGFSFDSLGFDEYIPDAILPGEATPVGVGSLTPIDEYAAPSEEWFLWSDGTYNRLPEGTGIRTPYDQLPDTYKAADTRSQQAAVPADRPLPDEPIYNPPVTPVDSQPAPVDVSSFFVPGAEIPESTGLNVGALDDLFANLRKTEELQKMALEPGLLQQGFTGTSGITAPPAGAGIFATPTQAEQPAIDFAVSPEMAAALQQVARPAEITREEIQAVQSNPRVQALQKISDLLKNNEFGAAFDEALKAERELGGDFVGNIIDANKLRELRGPMNADEITKFYNEMPQKVFEERYLGPGNEFKKDQAIERNIAALGGQAGYVDPMLGVKKEETLLSKLPIQELAALAAVAMGATAIPGLFGAGTTGGTAAGTAGTTGAAGATGASALTGVIPTGLVPGTTAAAVAAAGVPLAEVTVIASKLALSIPQAAALISSVGLGAAQALAGGTAAPTATTAATQPTAPSPSDLAEVVVTGTRVPVPPELIAGAVGAGTGAAMTQPTPPASQPVVETPLDQPLEEVTITAQRPPIENLLGLGAFTVPTTTPITAPEPIIVDGQVAYPDDLDEVVVTGTKPPLDALLGLGTVAIPTTTPVTLPEPVIVDGQITYPENDLEEVVVTGTRPPLDALLGLGTVAVPITTTFTPPSAPTPINTPSIVDTLLDKGQSVLTDAAISQLLSTLAGGTAGGAATGAGGGGGYAGTGGLGYIPEGQERKYFGAPGDYRHGFLPEWMFFENLNPPAVIDTTQSGTTGGGTTGGGGGGGRTGGTDDGTTQQKAIGGAIKSYSPRGYLEMIQGYNEGGEIEETMMEDSDAPMTDGSRQLIPLTQAAILGQMPEDQTDDVIQKFIDLHGNRAFRKLREETLESVANGSRKEGMVEGHTGGMDDMVDGVIGSSERVAVSPGEFIIPADVVSMLGDGNSDSGRHKLEQMMSRVRKDKTGSTKQARPINSAKVLPA